MTFDVIDDTGENFSSTSATTTPTGTVTTGTPFGSGFNTDESSLYSQIGSSGAQFLIDAGDTAYDSGSETEFRRSPAGSAGQLLPRSEQLLRTHLLPPGRGDPDVRGRWRPQPGPHQPEGVADTDLCAGLGRDLRLRQLCLRRYRRHHHLLPRRLVRLLLRKRPDLRDRRCMGRECASGRLGNTTGTLCGGIGSTTAVAACEPYQADADEHWQTTSPEYQWLAADLAAHPGGVKLAVFHFPLRSDSASQPSDPYTQNSRRIRLLQPASRPCSRATGCTSPSTGTPTPTSGSLPRTTCRTASSSTT